MPHKDPKSKQEYNKSYLKNHYQNNKGYYKSKRDRLKKESREFIIEQKKNKPCKDCNKIFHFSCMQFDHLPGFEKRFNISDSARGYSITTLKEEMAKCELVCANCHAYRTWLRRQSSIV